MELPNHQEPQQSKLYGIYLKRLRWHVESVQGVQVFFKSFPFGYGLMKIHRPKKLPEPDRIRTIVRERKIRSLVIEPVLSQSEQELDSWVTEVRKFVTINRSVFLPTKTIMIDLAPGEQEIFSHFTEAKRRAVRRAGKLGITITESTDMNSLIRIKNASAGLFGFITTSGMRQLWDVFCPDNASVLLAHDAASTLVGGVFLIHWDGVSYYWIAGSTKYGKTRYAPTLLVWEALRLSKKHGSRLFDFVGIWDERLPRQNQEWIGFTKFKQGFGGTEYSYPLVKK